MRNLAVYPITMTEITDCLEEMAKRVSDEELIGDIRPLCLKMAKRIVERAAFAVSEIHTPKIMP
jgi:hypothetical protein